MFLPLVLDQNLSGIAAVAEDLAEHLGKFERLQKPGRKRSEKNEESQCGFLHQKSGFGFSTQR